jgi:hypothetical protein
MEVSGQLHDPAASERKLSALICTDHQIFGWKSLPPSLKMDFGEDIFLRHFEGKCIHFVCREG